MMSERIHEMLQAWEHDAPGSVTDESYLIQVPVEMAARLKALTDMYPNRNINGILTDLVATALRDLESHFPYIRGDRVIALDEEGDPMYEDIGPTPRYLALTRKYVESAKRNHTH